MLHQNCLTVNWWECMSPDVGLYGCLERLVQMLHQDCWCSKPHRGHPTDLAKSEEWPHDNILSMWLQGDVSENRLGFLQHIMKTMEIVIHKFFVIISRLFKSNALRHIQYVGIIAMRCVLADANPLDKSSVALCWCLSLCWCILNIYTHNISHIFFYYRNTAQRESPRETTTLLHHTTTIWNRVRLLKSWFFY